MVSKDTFDAALCPGFREAMQVLYQQHRQTELEHTACFLDEAGALKADYMLYRPCPMCASTGPFSEQLHVHGLRIVTCCQCDFTFSENVLKPEVDIARYVKHTEDVEHSARLAIVGHRLYQQLIINKAHYVLSQLKPYRLSSPGRILDIGCGTGDFLSTAAQQGWQPLGVEVNPLFVAQCRQRGLDVICGHYPHDSPELSEASFQVITLFDVLEHIIMPLPFLQQLKQSLENDGLLIIQVPNYHSLAIRLQGPTNNNFCLGHWSYFTLTSLIRMLAIAGFRLCHAETIISELDSIKKYSTDQIHRLFQQLSGGCDYTEPLTAEKIHSAKLGYKLFIICRKDE